MQAKQKLSYGLITVVLTLATRPLLPVSLCCLLLLSSDSSPSLALPVDFPLHPYQLVILELNIGLLRLAVSYEVTYEKM